MFEIGAGEPMKNKITYTTIITLLFINLLLYTNTQHNIHVLQTSQDGLQLTVDGIRVYKDTKGKNEGLNGRINAQDIDNMKADIKDLQEKWVRWDLDWRKQFEPMQKYYEKRENSNEK